MPLWDKDYIHKKVHTCMYALFNLTQHILFSIINPFRRSHFKFDPGPAPVILYMIHPLIIFMKCFVFYIRQLFAFTYTFGWFFKCLKFWICHFSSVGLYMILMYFLFHFRLTVNKHGSWKIKGPHSMGKCSSLRYIWLFGLCLIFSI